ncbi:Glycosyl hydrolases family 31 [Streptoalloteichus tenebrarius]|uniref:Glycosyl hydrolases family 31 n=1 Tax=Streptoalloteichus tenebrarius (strain ATCC 17920 / DSM 40477 / JCM 4838 / CBS 697.72 / NBRC 16177 / NCIMB 11028 / NRRL B-12390 / A12253. 1 / ISP 5477) TaxID=1933 RepID=A0ABT1HQJ9_STRSD|nr:Glycosyl hydrolases family 31 [Streptoalloteichus tenebrarius]
MEGRRRCHHGLVGRVAGTVGRALALLMTTVLPLSMAGSPGAGVSTAATTPTSVLSVPPGRARAPEEAIVDGPTRFMVLSPTLVRLEYARDGRFEDRPSFNAVNRDFPGAAFDTWVEDGTRVIRTERLTLRHRQDGEPFGPDNLSVDLTAGDRAVTARPSFADGTGAGAPSPGNLGGWRRSLDLASGPVPLHDGLLSREGWYLLDDSRTALVAEDGSLVPRAPRDRPYQDGYFFGYGHDYRQGLRDLRDLTGPPMLLPRWAFGNWFSRYHPYSAANFQQDVVPRFRARRVPLDVLVVDTDYKSPDPWNGWNWNRKLFPDPAGFLTWARKQGLRVALNIHNSISPRDPKYAQVRAMLGKDLPKGDCPTECHVFDWADEQQLRAYFELHRPFEDQGVRLWWNDWCCDGSRADIEGVTPDTWLNAQYALRDEKRGFRGFTYARGGSGFTGYGESQQYPQGPWAEHRYNIHFTADTNSSWELLPFAAFYTAAHGNTGNPYVTHDIGAHNAEKLPDDLYARWIQLGTFQPILRLHSNHGLRLPWDYPGPAQESAEAFLRLRSSLVPYSYSLARQAHDTGLPIVRPLYLNYPEHDEAYSHKHEFLYGDDVLVAPVTRPGTGAVDTPVWFPPGTWVDYFTGRRHTGPGTATVSADLSRMPVFLRAGGVLPTRSDYVDHSDQRPMTAVTLDVAAGGSGSFDLYEDAGEGLGYRHGQHATTPIRYHQDNGRQTGNLTIGAAQGHYPGQVAKRAWTARFRDVDPPTGVWVNGAGVGQSASGPGYSYDPASRTLTVRTAPVPTARATTVGFAVGKISSLLSCSQCSQPITVPVEQALPARVERLDSLLRHQGPTRRAH